MARTEKIMKRVQEHYDYLISHGYNVAFIALQGSQNYEMDIYTEEYMSDVDTKAVIIPTLKEIALGRAPFSQTIVLENNEHIDVKDIRIMVEMFRKQNISYLELLFTPFKIINPEYAELTEILFSQADRIAEYDTVALFKALKGMALEKQKALRHPYPNTLEKIAKFGYDPKQLHHIARICYMVELLNVGHKLRDCFVLKNKEYLIEIKLGCYSEEEAVEMAAKFIKELSEICNRVAAQNYMLDSWVEVFLNGLVVSYLELSIKKELGVK